MKIIFGFWKQFTSHLSPPPLQVSLACAAVWLLQVAAEADPEADPFYGVLGLGHGGYLGYPGYHGYPVYRGYPGYPGYPGLPPQTRTAPRIQHVHTPPPACNTLHSPLLYLVHKFISAASY